MTETNVLLGIAIIVALLIAPLVIVGLIIWRDHSHKALGDREPRSRTARDLKFQKGTVIVCPECNRELATAKRDIYSGEHRSSGDWKWTGIVPVRGLPKCEHCGAPYWRIGQRSEKLHTKEC